MKIAVDIDDTLNIVERVRYATEYVKKLGLPFQVKNPNPGHFRETMDWDEESATHFVKRGGGLLAFSEAEARPHAQAVLQSWVDDGHEIIILTARFRDWFGNPKEFSRKWLEMKNIPYCEIVTDVDEKGLYCKENGIPILVDDSIRNCQNAVDHGVIPVLAVGAHNAEQASKFPYRGKNWQEIDAVVRGIIASRKI